MRSEIIGHRGYSAQAPENTLAALRAAVEAGADAVEFDLHVASCGTPVLFHDANLGRTTNGVGPIRRRTLGQLRVLDAGSWFDAEFAGEGIPTLEEALEEIAPRVGRVYAEVKGYRELEDLDRMVTIARRAGALDRVTFISLDWGTVERIHGQDDAVTIGYVVDRADWVPFALDRAVLRGRALVDLRADLVLDEPALLHAVHRDGIPTVVWTVNEVETAERLHELGVRRFTTDEVEALVAWRDGG
jgi:glycerophosphoryl diester phosphodiesterase